MDIRTLIIASVVVALSISLLMVLMRWTRRTYPGFNVWPVFTAAAISTALSPWIWSGANAAVTRSASPCWIWT